MTIALSRSNITPGEIEGQLVDLKNAIDAIEKMLNGSNSRSAIGERNPAGMQNYLSNAMNGMRIVMDLQEFIEKVMKLQKRFLLL